MTSFEPVAQLPAVVLAGQLGIPAAWERVHKKAGMPGVDGQASSTFARTVPAALSRLQHELSNGTYQALPLRLAELEKKDGGRRTLLVPAVRDKIVQTAVAFWLGAKWNAEFDAASFAYRPGLGVRPALRYLRDLYRTGFRWVFDADIRACFDSISHDLLFDRVDGWLGTGSPMGSWIRQWVAAPVWDGADLSRLTRGIPQGSSLSPLLSNFFLDTFDRRLRANGIKFVRYADDFLVLARTPFDLAAARQLAESALTDLGLSLNTDKTRSTSFAQWFRFLGAEIHGDDILLPFERQKSALAPVFVAPRMPPALLRAWLNGALKATVPFEPASRRRQGSIVAPESTHDRTRVLVSRLAGRRP